MLTLLLGSDDFSKKEYLNSEIKKTGAAAEFYFSGEEVGLEKMLQQDLFGLPKIFVLAGLWTEISWEKHLDDLAKSRNKVFILEKKLDKRLALSKRLLDDKRAEKKEFILPHGRELDKWILRRAGELGGEIEISAAGELAKKLGRDDFKSVKQGGKVVEAEEAYNLWQADSEIKKLLAFAKNRPVRAADVENLMLVEPRAETFDIANAVAEKNFAKTSELVNRFLEQESGGDKKLAMISLNGLLGEQFRSLLLAKNFMAQKIPEAQILESTGWKSGRLFMVKKNAAVFSAQKILEFLKRLEHFDEELKLSGAPPRPILDLIISGLFV